MKIVNNINEEIKSLTFYFNKVSMVSSGSENASGDIQSMVRFVTYQLANNKFETIEKQKYCSPSQYTTLRRSIWNDECCMGFMDIDSTEGVDKVFENMDVLFKTFNNIIYVQKSWSGKLHICIYLKTSKDWNEQTWKRAWVFWNAYINEWLSRKLHINYLEILDESGKPALDGHNGQKAQPFKLSPNDIYVNPYFNKKSEDRALYDNNNEIIKGSGISVNQLIEYYMDRLKISQLAKTGNQILEIADKYEIDITDSPSAPLVVDNMSRLKIAFMLTKAGIDKDKIIEIMYERTISAHSKKGLSQKEWNKQEIIKALKQADTYSSTKPGVFNTWASQGIYYAKRIGIVLKDSICSKKEIEDTSLYDVTVTLGEHEYIGQNNLQTIIKGFDNNSLNNILISAPTGTGKTEAAKAIAKHYNKLGYTSYIVANTNALKGEYAKSEDITEITDVSTGIKVGCSYSMVYDKFTDYYYDSAIAKKNVLVIIDEVHVVTEGQSYRPACSRLQNDIIDMSNNANVKLIVMSATVDSLTNKLLDDKAFKIKFQRKDTRNFTLQVTDNKMDSVIYRSMKSKWATKVCVFSDFAVGKNTISHFESQTDKKIGFYVGEHNTHWRNVNRMNILKSTEIIDTDISFFSNAGFAGLNIKNQNERFIIIIDYATLVSCADVAQILGRFRYDNNQYLVYVILNDNMWIKIMESGYIKESEKKPEYTDPYSMSAASMSISAEELFAITENKKGSDESLTLEETARIAALPKDVRDYFRIEHVRKNEYTNEYEHNYLTLINLLMSYGIVHFSDIILIDSIDGTTVTNENKHLTKMIDRYVDGKSVDNMRDECGQIVYGDGGKPEYNNKKGNILEQYTYNIKKLIDIKTDGSYEQFEKQFNFLYAKIGQDIDIVINGGKEKTCAEIYSNFVYNEWQSLSGLYSSINLFICDILWNDPILKNFANDVMEMWKYRTEITAGSFLRSIKFTFIGFYISDVQYAEYMDHIDKYLLFLGHKIHWYNNNDGEAMAREYQADMKEEYKKRDCLENGRKYKGDIKGLIDSLKADYTDKKEKRIEAGKNGDRKKKSEGGKKSKTNNNKKCCVMVVYRDRSEIIEADSRKEMTEKLKGLYVGTKKFWGNNEVNDFYTGKKDKLSCAMGGFYVILKKD